MVRGEEVYRRRRRLLETVYIEESVSERRRRDRFFLVCRTQSVLVRFDFF